MNILILDNYDSFTYNLVQLVEEYALCNYAIFKNDQISLDQVKEFDKILLSPGPGLPQEAGIMCELIRTFASQKSILGICLGHQAIAEVFGSQLIQLPKVFHGAMHRVSLADQDERLFAKVPNPFAVGLYHSWAVDPSSLSPKLKITAQSDQGIVMALCHRDYDVKGLQFHPESIMTNHGRTILYNWLDA